MNRRQLEHLIRASTAIAAQDTVVVVGSASILASFPILPDEFAEIRGADVYPPTAPELSDLIDAAIGRGSRFDLEYGYYAHGVAPRTVTLPDGWEHRLVRLEDPKKSKSAGLCLEPHDLAVSKIMTGHEKDVAFVRAMVRHGMVEANKLQHRLATVPVPDGEAGRVTDLLRLLPD